VNAAVATRDWLEDPVTFFSSLVIPLYAAAVAALWLVARPYGDAKWKLACTSALVAAALAITANQAISHVWDRPRPFAAHPLGIHLLSAPSTDPSFPSDHAAAAFSIAFAILALSRRAGLAFVVVAALIAASRVALGLHYPSDVLAGAVVGWSAAAFVTELGTSWITRMVKALSRLSDPVLAHVWRLVGRRLSAGRS